MTIDTTRFGVIDIDGTRLISFLDGIPGFEDCKRFAILYTEDTYPICWLQSVDDPDVCLGIMNSYLVMPNYMPDVSDDLVYDLNIQDHKNLMVFSVVVIPEDYTKMTANMAAPIIINTENNLGKQAIIQNNEYTVQYPVFGTVFQNVNNTSKGATNANLNAQVK